MKQRDLCCDGWPVIRNQERRLHMAARSATAGTRRTVRGSVMVVCLPAGVADRRHDWGKAGVVAHLHVVGRGGRPAEHILGGSRTSLGSRRRGVLCAVPPGRLLLNRRKMDRTLACHARVGGRVGVRLMCGIDYRRRRVANVRSRTSSVVIDWCQRRMCNFRCHLLLPCLPHVLVLTKPLVALSINVQIP